MSKNKLKMGQPCLVSDISERDALNPETEYKHEYLFTSKEGGYCVKTTSPTGICYAETYKYAVSAPEKVEKSFTFKTFPYGAMFKRPGGYINYTHGSVGETFIFMDDGAVTFKDLLNDWEYSLDGCKTWHKCSQGEM